MLNNKKTIKQERDNILFSVTISKDVYKRCLPFLKYEGINLQEKIRFLISEYLKEHEKTEDK
jgi:hypothetical protein